MMNKISRVAFYTTEYSYQKLFHVLHPDVILFYIFIFYHAPTAENFKWDISRIPLKCT